MRFAVAPWLRKESDFHKSLNNGNPIPMVIMFGRIVRETDKSYLIDVYGKPEPTEKCLHCGRKLTNKVSMYYGLGPICGQHYYITNVTEATLRDNFDSIRKLMANIKWRGWIPKNSVKITMEKIHTIVFQFNGSQYKVITSDETKVKEIYEKAEVIISDTVQEG